jgi:hypothetical protein
MTRLVHVTTAGNAVRIARGGTRPGLFAMAVLPSFTLTHQWVREMRRFNPGELVAVDLTVPGSTPVSVGHYGRTRSDVPLAEAAGLIRSLADPRGYEIVVPPALPRSAVVRVRRVPQGVGWRYVPGAHGRRPCACPVCLAPGTPGSARVRRRFTQDGPEPTKPELMAQLSAATTSDDVMSALWGLYGRSRGGAEELAYLADHPDPDVRELLYDTLAFYRGRAARDLRARLAPGSLPAPSQLAPGD